MTLPTHSRMGFLAPHWHPALLCGTVFGAALATMTGWFAPRFESQHGQPLLDLLGPLSASEAQHILEIYGPAGRASYLWFLWTLDLIFPIAGSLFLVALVRALTWRASPESWLARRGRQLSLLVWAPAAADLLENLRYSAQVLAQPAPEEPLMGLLHQFGHWPSLLKHGLLLISGAAVAMLLVHFLVRTRRAPAYATMSRRSHRDAAVVPWTPLHRPR